MKLTDVKPSGLKLLQYGESGSGKSVRAARFAQFGPLYLFDFDGKAINLRSFFQNDPTILANLDVQTYGAKDYEAIKTKLAAIAASCASGKPMYATVVLDSWTEFERIYMDVLMSKHQALGGKKWGVERQEIRVTRDELIVMPGTSDHQLKNRAFPAFITALTALPINVVINCHIKEPPDQAATIQASGEVAKTLPKYFHEWHYLYVFNGAHRVRVKPSNDYLANTALPNVPPTGVLDKDDLSVYPQLFRLSPEPCGAPK
jgi:hypothetical protein